MPRIRKLIAASGLGTGECIVIHKPSNVFYFSGFTGEGQLVIGQGLAAIVTDFRYAEQAGIQSPGWKVIQISAAAGHARAIAALLGESGLGAARYEDDCVTVRAHRELADAMPGVALSPLGNLPESLRSEKDEGELDKIRKACAISSGAFESICGMIRPGMTEKEIRLALDDRMLAAGASATAFPTIVASGPNGSLPHAVPGERRVEKGDMITLDFGARADGYCSDMTRTVALGKPSPLMREIYGIVLDAQKASQEALAPGKSCKEIDAVARDRIALAGYGERFGHGLGHSLGIDIHEEPRLNATSSETLRSGHVVTVEPGIYLPGVGGVRIENTCLITSGGGESLVESTRELLIL